MIITRTIYLSVKIVTYSFVYKKVLTYKFITSAKRMFLEHALTFHLRFYFLFTIAFLEFKVRKSTHFLLQTALHGAHVFSIEIHSC